MVEKVLFLRTDEEWGERVEQVIDKAAGSAHTGTVVALMVVIIYLLLDIRRTANYVPGGDQS